MRGGREQSDLERAFVEDHQRLIRGISRVIDAVRREDAGAARRAADDLDRAVGPHMEFEEEVLYPLVAAAEGRDYAEQLYAEHAAGRAAVSLLRRLQAGQEFPAAQRSAALDSLQLMLDHALSCGTLLGHLIALGAPRQRELLADLLARRARGRRWSEIPPHAISSAADGAR